MKVTKSETKIEIKVPPNRELKNMFVFGFSIFFTIPIFILYVCILIKCIIYWNFYTINFEECFYGILGAFIFLNYSLWLYIGNEKIVFSENIMEFTITNGIFKVKKNIEISLIKNLRTVDKVYNSDLPFIRDSGRIKFEYKGKYFNILRGLKDEEVEEIGEIFKKQIT